MDHSSSGSSCRFVVALHFVCCGHGQRLFRCAMYPRQSFRAATQAKALVQTGVAAEVAAEEISAAPSTKDDEVLASTCL
jgi:small ligand-binding sensory domain FIST